MAIELTNGKLIRKNDEACYLLFCYQCYHLFSVVVVIIIIIVFFFGTILKYFTSYTLSQPLPKVQSPHPPSH